MYVLGELSRPDSEFARTMGPFGTSQALPSRRTWFSRRATTVHLGNDDRQAGPSGAVPLGPTAMSPTRSSLLAGRDHESDHGSGLRRRLPDAVPFVVRRSWLGREAMLAERHPSGLADLIDVGLDDGKASSRCGRERDAGQRVDIFAPLLTRGGSEAIEPRDRPIE